MTRTVVCDLDGVVYLGEEAIEGAGAALEAVERDGDRLVFCTNNSSRTRAQAAEKIARVTGHEVGVEQVASSAMAAAMLLDHDRVVMIGGEGVVEAIEQSGSTVVARHPADAVVVGIDPTFDYDALDRASDAVRRGARFIATNGDVTFPSPAGLKPGGGSLVAAVAAASGCEPVVAGKPHEPMRRLLADMTADGDVVMVGDRPDTDLAMARAEGWISVLVHTGITPPGTPVEPAPDHVIASIADLPDLLRRI